MTQTTKSPVQILKVGHALVEGKRGMNGGAPSKDSIWGVATIQGNVVKFFGRRGGKLRFKTERRVDLDIALQLFEEKCSGTAGKDYQYVELSVADQETLTPNLADVIKTGFYKAMATGKLNTNSTKKVKKVTA